MPYEEKIAALATEYGFTPQYLTNVMMTESGGNPNAVSPAGAQGLLQIMPKTGKQYGLKNPFDPDENLTVGVKHLAYLRDLFGGDLYAATAAYNMGEGGYRKVLDGKRSLPTETRNYLARLFPFGPQTYLDRETVTEGPSGFQPDVSLYPTPPPGSDFTPDIERYRTPDQPDYLDPLWGLLDPPPQPQPQQPPQPPQQQSDGLASLFGNDGGAYRGLNFQDERGETQVAFPETASEATELEGFARYDPKQRGQLVGVAPMFRAVRDRLNSNRFLKYPDFYDGAIRDMVKRSGRGDGSDV
jgi:hypothetical protein